MKLEGRKVTLHDMCLRDGMHPKQHQITVDQMVDIAGALDDAGVPLIEVTHGDGLGGASVNYGFPAASDETYLRAVVERVSQAGISALLLPGIGLSIISVWRPTVASPRFAWPRTVPKPTYPGSTLT